jgi:MFS family permease
LSKQIISPGNRGKPAGFFYGYAILIASFFIMVFTYGSQGSFGVFFKPMLNEFGWTRAATAGPFALYMIISGLLSIVSGQLSDRFGPRIVVIAGALILGAGYILTSRITALWQLYLSYGVLVAAGSSAMYVPPVTLIARWFTRRRGLMSGIGISGIGFGIGIMPAIASQLIVSFDWRTALLGLGIFNLVAITMLGCLLRNPADREGASNQDRDEMEISRGFSFREAVKTPQYWMIFTAWVFYGFLFQVGVVHTVPYATDLGMTPVAAATVLTTIGIIGTFGRISLGFIGDRIGNRTIIFLSFALMGAAYLGLALSESLPMLFVFAVVFGALSGIGILLIPLLAEHYGFKELGFISGSIVFANSAGGAISPPLAGGIFDTTGSYRLAFIICAVLGIAASLIIWRLKK